MCLQCIKLNLLNFMKGRSQIVLCDDKGLRCLIQHGMGPRNSLNWTSEAEEHFDALKIAITCTPALGLQDYSRPFHFNAGETVGVAMGVLTQEHGGKPRPVSYLSRQFSPLLGFQELTLFVT